MATRAREIGRLFTPLQVGYIADCVEPLSAGSDAGWALQTLSERPELGSTSYRTGMGRF